MSRLRVPAAAFGLVGMILPALTFADEISHDCLERARIGDISACEDAAEAAPGDLDLQRVLARAYIEIGDFASAVDVYEAIAKAKPDDFGALYDLSGALGFVRRYEESSRVLKRMIALEPGNVETHKALAITYLQLDLPEDAFAETRAAAELGEPVAMYDMFIYLRDGFGTVRDPARAVEWAERAAEAGHLKAMAKLIEIYQQGLMGRAVDDEKAVKWARRLHERESQ